MNYLSYTFNNLYTDLFELIHFNFQSYCIWEQSSESK
jgi:hypothetical protein